jgi:hypothetical protein
MRRRSPGPSGRRAAAEGFHYGLIMRAAGSGWTDGKSAVPALLEAEACHEIKRDTSRAARFWKG